jgi:hypothetical protein
LDGFEMLSDAPDMTLEAVRTGGSIKTGTGSEGSMVSADSPKLETDTTYQARVVLTGSHVAEAQADSASGTVTITSGKTWANNYRQPDGTDPKMDVAGKEMIVENQNVLYDTLNKTGASIGAVIDTAESTTDVDGTSAAFTVYITGSTVSHLPLTGGLGTPQVLLLITLGTLLLAGLVAGASYLTRKSRNSTHAVA